MAKMSALIYIYNLKTYSEPGRTCIFALNQCLLQFIWFFYRWLITSVQQDGNHLCSYVCKKISFWVFYPPACNLFCLPCCYISSQWCQAGLWSAITLKNNGIKGSARALLLAWTYKVTLETSPAPSLPVLIGWNICSLCHFWHVIYCRQPQRREPVDKSSLGPSVFYGYHVLTAKLCLSVPSAPGLNVKQPSMQGSPLRRAMWFSGANMWLSPVGKCLQVSGHHLKIVLNPMTSYRHGGI